MLDSKTRAKYHKVVSQFSYMLNVYTFILLESVLYFKLLHVVNVVIVLMFYLNTRCEAFTETFVKYVVTVECLSDFGGVACLTTCFVHSVRVEYFSAKYNEK